MLMAAVSEMMASGDIGTNKTVVQQTKGWEIADGWDKTHLKPNFTCEKEVNTRTGSAPHKRTSQKSFHVCFNKMDITETCCIHTVSQHIGLEHLQLTV